MSTLLNSVHLDDLVFPCVTYALRRTGINLTVGELLSITGIPYKEELLSVGDIIFLETYRH